MLRCGGQLQAVDIDKRDIVLVHWSRSGLKNVVMLGTLLGMVCRVCFAEKLTG